MSRWKAAFMHLMLSALVVGCVAAFIVYYWYPPALMHMAKADRLLMIIAGVDVVAGPLLTLIVFKANKPKLKLDLAIIGLLQLSFLCFGLHASWQSRPVFLVAVPDRFELVFANEITEKRLSAAKIDRFRKLSIAGPVLVGTKMPENIGERNQILMSAIRSEGDIQVMPQYYVEYSQVKLNLLKHAKPLIESKGLAETDADALRQAAKSYGYSPEDLRYVQLASSRGFASMLITARTADVVGPVNIDP